MPHDRPRLLLIETSGQTGRLGLAVGPDLLDRRELDSTRRHARDLAPAVADLLRGRGWRPTELAGVLVGLGPGSYTGLRVGIMSAKALAYATGCAVVGVPTFHAIARQAEVPGLELEVIADAQRGKLYVQPFARAAASEPFAPASDLAVVPGRQWARGRKPDVAVTGPGLGVAGQWLPPETPTVPTDSREPTVAALLTAGLERYAHGVRDDALRVEPIYLRPSSAEEQWERRS